MAPNRKQDSAGPFWMPEHARLAPHAYDPRTRPALFDNILTLRMMAFIYDLVVIFVLSLMLAFILLIAGVFTLGLTWLLLGLALPLTALAYNAYTIGGPEAATYGMRYFNLELRLWNGERLEPLWAAFHAISFYISVSLLTPLVLLFPLFNARKRCLHDYVLGSVMIKKAG